MQFDTDEIELALRREVAWSLCSVLKDIDLPLYGSWTFFNKLVSIVKYEAVVQEYLPVKSHRLPDSHLTILYVRNIFVFS